MDESLEKGGWAALAAIALGALKLAFGKAKRVASASVEERLRDQERIMVDVQNELAAASTRMHLFEQRMSRQEIVASDYRREATETMLALRDSIDHALSRLTRIQQQSHAQSESNRSE